MLKYTGGHGSSSSESRAWQELRVQKILLYIFVRNVPHGVGASLRRCQYPCAFQAQWTVTGTGGLVANSAEFRGSVKLSHAYARTCLPAAASLLPDHNTLTSQGGQAAAAEGHITGTSRTGEKLQELVQIQR
jgi:hypothetical protein